VRETSCHCAKTGDGRIPYSTKIKAVWLMVLGTAPLTPQQTGDQSAGPVIRVTVDLVQVDAVVTDSKGRHVTGLKPEDLQILEDGKPQKITHFSYVPGNAIAGGPTPVNPEPRRPSGKTRAAIPAPVKALPEEDCAAYGSGSAPPASGCTGPGVQATDDKSGFEPPKISTRIKASTTAPIPRLNAIACRFLGFSSRRSGGASHPNSSS
jgi:hypothetical protein